MKHKLRKYGPNKNRFDDGPYISKRVVTAGGAERFVVQNKNGNWVEQFGTPVQADVFRDKWNYKHAEWLMVKP
jgi:hypothetical protein